MQNQVKNKQFYNQNILNIAFFVEKFNNQHFRKQSDSKFFHKYNTI